MPRRDREGAFAAQVIAWQRRAGRQTLPWQNTRDPYRIWLSEVMLQQTQVATVLAYYERFVERFADVHSLAAAPLDDVLALWSGLGYYSRARHLHRCAQVVVAEHGGQFPRSAAALATLPGIGRSTAAAIAAFAYGERAAILDGNVKRVLARVLGFDGDLADPKQTAVLWEHADALLPTGEGIEAYTQGLMDIGATVCSARTPSCAVCPLHRRCIAAASGEPARWPVKSRRSARRAKSNVWLWLRWRDRHWLIRRPPHGIWAGLWSLPEFDDDAAFNAVRAGWPGRGETLPGFTHVLTHLDWHLSPRRWTLPARCASARAEALTARWPHGRWCTLDEALAMALPAPLKRLLAQETGGPQTA